MNRSVVLLGLSLVIAASCGGTIEQRSEITVYGSPRCPMCVDLKEELEEREVAHVFVDLSVDNDAVIALTSRLASEAWFNGRIEMPIVEVGGRFLRRPSVDDVLRAAKTEPVSALHPSQDD